MPGPKWLDGIFWVLVPEISSDNPNTGYRHDPPIPIPDLRHSDPAWLRPGIGSAIDRTAETRFDPAGLRDDPVIGRRTRFDLAADTRHDPVSDGG